LYDTLKRPSNPIVRDIAFSRVNSEKSDSMGEESE